MSYLGMAKLLLSAPAPTLLRSLRERAGYSLADLARACGYRGPSSLQRYENPNDYTKEYLPLSLIRKLEKALVGRGDPPIEKSEVIALAGVNSDMVFHVGNTPDQLPTLRGDPGSGVVEFGNIEYVAVGRYDARLSAGPGSITDPHAEPLGYVLFESQWLRAIVNAAPEGLVLLRVSGDSMEPTFREGDWVLVDRGQTRFTGEGIYAIQFGDATLIKRIAPDFRNRGFHIMSDNRDRYRDEAASEEEMLFLGRVVWIVGRRV